MGLFPLNFFINSSSPFADFSTVPDKGEVFIRFVFRVTLQSMEHKGCPKFSQFP